MFSSQQPIYDFKTNQEERPTVRDIKVDNMKNEPKVWT